MSEPHWGQLRPPPALPLTPRLARAVLLIFSAIFDHSFPHKEKRRAQVLIEHGAKESHSTHFSSPVKKKR